MDNVQFVLGVDLDGVVADFYAGLRPIAAEWLGVEESTLTQDFSYNLPEWNLVTMGTYDDLHRFAVTQRQLFRVLKPIENAAPVLRRLSHSNIRIRIITHRLYIPYFHEKAVSQTTAWLDNYDIPYWDLCFMKDKAAVGANLYIEDSPSNVRSLRDQQLDVIVFENSTNHHVDPPRTKDWLELEKTVLKKYEDWKLLQNEG